MLGRKLFFLLFKDEFLIENVFQSKRGVFESSSTISDDRVILKYKLPLNEVLIDFFSKLKKTSSGYARYVRIRILLLNDKVKFA